jgi:hypothetical protein
MTATFASHFLYYTYILILTSLVIIIGLTKTIANFEEEEGVINPEFWEMIKILYLFICRNVTTPHLPFSPTSKKLSMFVNLLLNWCHTVNCAFILGNSCNFCASHHVPYVYNIRLHCERTRSIGHFRTVTSRRIHATHFMLMNKKVSFFLFECWPNKKKSLLSSSFFLPWNDSFFLLQEEKKGALLLLSYINRQRIKLTFFLFHSTKNVFLYKVNRRRWVFKTRMDAYLSLIESFFEFFSIFIYLHIHV